MLEHGGKAEKFAVGRFVDDDFLVVFVDSRDADAAGDHDVGMTVGVSDLVDALTWSEFLQFDLTGKDRCFIVIEKRFSQPDLSDLPAQAAELVRSDVALILASSLLQALAVRQTAPNMQW